MAKSTQILDYCPKSMPTKLGNGLVLDGTSNLYLLLQHYSIIIQYGRNFQNVQGEKNHFCLMIPKSLPKTEIERKHK